VGRVWTFVRCGIHGNPKGVYGPEYEDGIRGNMARVSPGDTCEFIHDEDMPEALRYRGSHGCLAIYDPDLEIGNDDGNIYFLDLDSLIVGPLDRMADAMNAVSKDIVGNICPSDGQMNTMAVRVRRGSRGALAVWNNIKALGFDLPVRPVEHKLVRRYGGNYTGMMADGCIESYRIFKKEWGPKFVMWHPLESVCAIAFHGPIKQAQICADKDAPLHTEVMDLWGRYAGY
jgi:hypothetical protein